MRLSHVAATRLAAAILAALVVAGCYQRTERRPDVDDASLERADDRPELTLAVVPTRPPREAVLRYGPIAEHLTRRTSRRVTLRPAATLSIALERLADGTADLALLGAAALVRARERIGAVGLVRLDEAGGVEVRGAIVVREDDPARSLEDLRGRRLALVDAESTTGRLLTLTALSTRGLGPGDLAAVRYVGLEESVVRSVLLGESDAGGVREHTAARHAHRGLRILWLSEPVPGLVLACGPSLPEEVRDEIRRVLLQSEDGILPADVPVDSEDRLRFRPVGDRDHATVEKLMVDLYGDSALADTPRAEGERIAR
jgi:phosphonate transport system substrate-binding protein